VASIFARNLTEIHHSFRSAKLFSTKNEAMASLWITPKFAPATKSDELPA